MRKNTRTSNSSWILQIVAVNSPIKIDGDNFVTSYPIIPVYGIESDVGKTSKKIFCEKLHCK